MTILARILTGSAGLAMAVGAASPAMAQYSPYGNTGSGGVGAVINQILGGGRYGAYGQGNDRIAVDQCARAAEARVSHTNRANASRNYGQAYGDPRYANQGYGYNAAAMARVVGITQVQRQRSGLRVSGVIDSGMNNRIAYGSPGYGYGNQGYPNQGYSPYANQGYANAYGQNAQVADLRFSCRVDFQGRISDLDIKRNVASRRGF